MTKFPQYFINDKGVIHTISGESSCTYCEMFSIVETPDGLHIWVLEENDPFGEEEYQLWNSLKLLEETIE